MDLKEFYAKYNLNNDVFAPIAGVGVTTLIKYTEGKTIREDARMRIEKAIRVAEKYNLVRPRYNYGKAYHNGYLYKDDYYREVRNYKDRFKAMLRRRIEL